MKLPLAGYKCFVLIIFYHFIYLLKENGINFSVRRFRLFNTLVKLRVKLRVNYQVTAVFIFVSRFTFLQLDWPVDS